VVAARAGIPRGPKVRGLLRGLAPTARFGVGPYRKWDGPHWRLVSLADLRYPAGDERLWPVIDAELDWALACRPLWVNGRARRCVSQEGNAIGACCRLGFGDDPRIGPLVDRLTECQWPDGGWNCDKRPEASHSSFHESIIPVWGLGEYRRTSGDDRVDGVIERAVDMFLRAGLFRTERRREAAWPHFLKLRYPPYWHYDVLFGLRVLVDVGVDLAGDGRAAEALDIVEAARRPDGRWAANGKWWRGVGSSTYPEAVDWGPSKPNEMVTFHALRVLKARHESPFEGAGARMAWLSALRGRFAVDR
jgi:hypothetical protein